MFAVWIFVERLSPPFGDSRFWPSDPAFKSVGSADSRVYFVSSCMTLFDIGSCKLEPAFVRIVVL